MKVFFLISLIAIINKQIIEASTDSLTQILKEELYREFSILKNQNPPVYYLEYRAEKIWEYDLKSSFGSITNKNIDSSRVLSIIVRVGDYEFDNTHEIENIGSSYKPFVMVIPQEDKNALAIKQLLWKGTHVAYREAVNAYTQAKSAIERKNKKKPIADFTREFPQVYSELPLQITTPKFKEWSDRLKKYTSEFLEDTIYIKADASLSITYKRKYFVNSEGSQIEQNASYVQFQIVAIGKSNQGTFPLVLSYYSFSPDSLPSDDSIMKDIEKLKYTMHQLINASIADAYAGPAILSPTAAAVFFHEIFGHRIEGHRLKSNFDSQTFKKEIGKKILPSYINVYSDPTLKKFGNTDLFGYYLFDDQGVKSERVHVVKNGILNTFLMSRSPIDELNQSNGHGRGSIGKMPVSRQSNLIIESKKKYSEKKLRKKLIKECKRQNKEYGFYFKEVIGGFTQTSRYSPNVFNVKPTLVYKIYVDGRPDELVKGVNFIGTPLAIFSEISAMGEELGVFTGYCGAESGSLPVTAISPAILIKKIETQKKPESHVPSPILPIPKE